MVAQGRVELPALGYEPNMLPLHYRASNLVRTSRIELETSGWKPDTLPLRHARVIVFMVGPCGYAPLPVKERFYRPFAETIDFRDPKMVHLEGLEPPPSWT